MVIDGKTYTRKGSKKIASYWNGVPFLDFYYESYELRKMTATGYFYLVAHGGPHTRFSRSKKGFDCPFSGKMYIPLSAEDAEMWKKDPESVETRYRIAKIISAYENSGINLHLK